MLEGFMGWLSAKRMLKVRLPGLLLGCMLAIAPFGITQAAAAQSPAKSPAKSPVPSHCRIICRAQVSLIPSVITNHLFSRPTVRALATGAVQELPSTSNAELIFGVSAPTALERVALYGSVQWLPTASEKRNPFTLYAASDVGTSVRANAPTVSGGVSLAIVRPQDADGWASLDAHIGDLYSSAARPGDVGAYTHKLDLGLVASWSLFGALPKHTYLHGVSLLTLLDYVATGLPRAGDEVPKGERVFLKSARSASFIAGLSFPLTRK